MIETLTRIPKTQRRFVFAIPYGGRLLDYVAFNELTGYDYVTLSEKYQQVEEVLVVYDANEVREQRHALVMSDGNQQELILSGGRHVMATRSDLKSENGVTDLMDQLLEEEMQRVVHARLHRTRLDMIVKSLLTVSQYHDDFSAMIMEEDSAAKAIVGWSKEEGASMCTREEREYLDTTPLKDITQTVCTFPNRALSGRITTRDVPISDANCIEIARMNLSMKEIDRDNFIADSRNWIGKLAERSGLEEPLLRESLVHVPETVELNIRVSISIVVDIGSVMEKLAQCVGNVTH